MQRRKYPRLRTVDKVQPAYALNDFPNKFGYKLAREIVYLLATKGTPTLEGNEWEEIFAICINAEWKPSNVGLDDVVLESCAWGAKTVIGKPLSQKRVRLVIGRNSPIYSFGENSIADADPNHLGKLILDIWNERVSAVRKLYKHVRTVVLIKSSDLADVAIFEFDTIRYDPEVYVWKWNKNSNLEGFDRNEEHLFTWQPHGSQFTVIENIPEDCLIVTTKIPNKINKTDTLNQIGFNNNWIEVRRRND